MIYRLLMTKSRSMESHVEPIVCRGALGYVACDRCYLCWFWLVVVVFTFVGQSSLLLVHHLFGRLCWIPIGEKFCPTSFAVFGNQLHLIIYHALSEDP